MLLRFCLFILFSFFSLSLWAQTYTRGDYVCEDFSSTEEAYEEEQDIYTTMDYAQCLVIKGEDATGLSLLHHLVDRYNDVSSAFLIAYYIASYGDLIPTQKQHWDNPGLFDKAIAAYHRVLSFINGKNYPGPDYDLIELRSQYELRSHWSLIYLHLQKFTAGFIGLENWYLNHSPHYEGPKNLKSYPEYREYTEDSLKKARDLSQTCLLLPQKAHFKAYIYTDMMRFCKKTKQIAEDLLLLEREKLNLLYSNAECRAYVLECEAYLNLRTQIIDTFNEYSEVKGVF